MKLTCLTAFLAIASSVSTQKIGNDAKAINLASTNDIEPIVESRIGFADQDIKLKMLGIKRDEDDHRGKKIDGDKCDGYCHGRCDDKRIQGVCQGKCYGYCYKGSSQVSSPKTDSVVSSKSKNELLKTESAQSKTLSPSSKTGSSSSTTSSESSLNTSSSSTMGNTSIQSNSNFGASLKANGLWSGFAILMLLLAC